MVSSLSKVQGVALLNSAAEKFGLRIVGVRGGYQIWYGVRFLKMVRTHDDGLLFIEGWDMGKRVI